MADAERVLVLLVEHLRDVAGGVEREGSRIVLSGLGPSPRTINRNDTTVLDVRLEDGLTRIEAEVSFQASALLGPVGQEEIVREKLRGVLAGVKLEIEEERRRAEAERRQQLEQSRRAIEAQRDLVVEPKEELPLPPRPRATAPMVEVKDRALPEAKPVAVPEVREKPGAEAALDDSRASERVEDESEPRPKRRWIGWAALAACLLAAGPFAWRSLPAARQAPPTQAVASDAGPSAAQAPAVQSGPENAVRQWELAMRSTDAAAQVAYYAVPVEQYLWKHNVSRHDLEAMKLAEIARRRGLWTVKMEDVKVERDGDTAKVTLVKHTTEQPQGMHVRERFVPSQLTLRKSMGIWWIVSEHDVVARRKNTEEVVDEGETPSWARPPAATPSAAATAATPTPSSASIN